MNNKKKYLILLIFLSFILITGISYIYFCNKKIFITSNDIYLFN